MSDNKETPGEFAVPDYLIKELYGTVRMSAELRDMSNIFAAHSPQYPAWWQRHMEAEVTVRLPYVTDAIEAISAIRAACEGLQFCTIEWGSELDEPAIKGFVAGTVCERPIDGGVCQQLMGHPTPHA